MPPSESESLMNELVGAANVNALWDALANINVQKAKASVKSDKENILLYIARSTSFDAVNEEVRRRLTECFAENMELRAEIELVKISPLVSAGSPETVDVARLA